MSYIFMCYIFSIEEWNEECHVSILLIYKIISYPSPYEFEIDLYLDFGKWWNAKF
jgi:hypothetical protein